MRFSITSNWVLVVSTVSLGHAAVMVSFALADASTRSPNGAFCASDWVLPTAQPIRFAIRRGRQKVGSTIADILLAPCFPTHS